MPKKVGPYVGVTGFNSRTQVVEALVMVPSGSQRRLMVGVLMSSKTLAGQQNKWPGRYPEKQAVSNIFVDDPRVLNLVHYSTDDSGTLGEQIIEIAELAGPRLDGFQLNTAWPPLSELEKYRKTYPEAFLLLQIGGRAMKQASSMDRLAELVGEYQSLIDAVLIDPSGGKGLSLNPTEGAERLRVIRDCSTLGLGIAGGLGPETLSLVEPLIEEFSELSIDAEGRLRTSSPEDALCLETMRAYLTKAFRMLEGREQSA